MDRLKDLLDSGALPFLLATSASKIPKFSSVRVIEAIIISIIAGMIAAAASGYITGRILENNINHIMKTQKEIKQDNRDWYKEFRTEIKDVRTGLYTHIGSNHNNHNSPIP